MFWGVLGKRRAFEIPILSIVATAYTRLLATDSEPSDSVRAAFVHVSAMFPTVEPLSFDCCSEVISMSDARWGAADPRLTCCHAPTVAPGFLPVARTESPPLPVLRVAAHAGEVPLSHSSAFPVLHIIDTAGPAGLQAIDN